MVDGRRGRRGDGPPVTEARGGVGGGSRGDRPAVAPARRPRPDAPGRVALGLLVGPELVDAFECSGAFPATARPAGLDAARLADLLRAAGDNDAAALRRLLGAELLAHLRRLDAARTARVGADTVSRRAEFEVALAGAVRAFARWVHGPPAAMPVGGTRVVAEPDGRGDGPPARPGPPDVAAGRAVGLP